MAQRHDSTVSTSAHPQTGGERDLWVFGYGSLMWRPGFEFEEAIHARLAGFRRCFCVYSLHHRGTAERPGLVLGLDRGGACEGIAYRVTGQRARATLAYLRAREQISGVYRETLVPLHEIAGARREIRALAYLVERAHPSYAGALPLATQAALIRGARGISGANLDYLISTAEHLAQLKIRERELERLMALVGAFVTRTGECGVSSGHERARAATLRSVCKRVRTRLPRLKPGERKRFIHRLSMGAL